MFPKNHSNVRDGFGGLHRVRWKTSWNDIAIVMERKAVEVSKIYF